MLQIKLGTIFQANATQTEQNSSINKIFVCYATEGASARRWSSHKILKIESVSISATESSFLYSVKFHSDVIFRACVRVTFRSLQAIASKDKQNPVVPFFSVCTQLDLITFLH